MLYGPQAYLRVRPPNQYYFLFLKTLPPLVVSFFKKSNELIWGDVRWLRSMDGNLLSLVEKTENWKEAESSFVPALKTREAGLQVI